MEDKRYDPYTGYEIKDEDPTQEYHTQDDDPYRRYRYEDDHIEQPQQEQTSGNDPWNHSSCMHGQLLLHANRNYYWDCSGHLFCGDTKSQRNKRK